MKTEIESFALANEGVNYTTKELVSALHSKIDNIEVKIDSIKEDSYKRIVKCNDTFVPKPIFKVGFGLLFTLISALAGYVFYK